MEATPTVFPLVYCKHYCFSSSYTSGDCHCLITLPHVRLFFPIYAIIFPHTIHLSSFSRPGWLINHWGISVDFLNFLYKCLPLFLFLFYNNTTYKKKEKIYIYTVHYPAYTTYKNIQYTTLKHYKSCTICSYLGVLYILSFFSLYFLRVKSQFQ